VESSLTDKRFIYRGAFKWRCLKRLSNLPHLQDVIQYSLLPSKLFNYCDCKKFFL